MLEAARTDPPMTLRTSVFEKTRIKTNHPGDPQEGLGPALPRTERGSSAAMAQSCPFLALAQKHAGDNTPRTVGVVLMKEGPV